MKKYILAPHLDDEILGCFSFMQENPDCIVLYFYSDYRVQSIKENPRYVEATAEALGKIDSEDLVLIPSRHDYHPLHRAVNRLGKSMKAQKLYYSVEMNVPWLELEHQAEDKKRLFESMYPKEDMKNEKYFLFRSIKPYDSLVFAVVTASFEAMHKYKSAPEEVAFLRQLHRHEFKVSLKIQQFHDNRDIEYLLLKADLQKFISDNWQRKAGEFSCEDIARSLVEHFEKAFPDRIVRASVFEDGENGAEIE